MMPMADTERPRRRERSGREGHPGGEEAVLDDPQLIEGTVLGAPGDVDDDRGGVFPGEGDPDRGM